MIRVDTTNTSTSALIILLCARNANLQCGIYNYIHMHASTINPLWCKYNMIVHISILVLYKPPVLKHST